MSDRLGGEQFASVDANTRRVRHWSPKLRLNFIFLLIAVCLLGLRLWHIRADFSSASFYSQDGAKFTDEGFYTNAALNHYMLGHWHVPGGWNPGVFMPVWPLLVGFIFHFTGISIAAARSLAVICTWISALLVYAVARQYRSRMFALLVVLLFAANALGFFFSRLAILESALVMFTLLGIYLAGRVRPGGYWLAVSVGVVFTVMTLTKTTGTFLLPAVLYPVWARNRHNRPGVWKLLAVVLCVAFLFLVFIKLIWTHRYGADAAIILGLNPAWQLEHSIIRLPRFFFRGTWVDPILFPLAVFAFVAACVRLRALWADTLFMLSFLWEAGYAAFIVFHFDGPPRYFVLLIVPTILLALIFTEWLWQRHRRIGWGVAACIAASVVWNIAFIASYLAHPRYTLLNASMAIKTLVQSHPESNQLTIGRGADEFSLMSGGFPTMDSDGAMPLATKLTVYHPGWFVKWSFDVPLRTQTIAEHTRMVERGRFFALDPSHHTAIVLYQLLPKTGSGSKK